MSLYSADISLLTYFYDNSGSTKSDFIQFIYILSTGLITEIETFMYDALYLKKNILLVKSRVVRYTELSS